MNTDILDQAADKIKPFAQTASGSQTGLPSPMDKAVPHHDVHYVIRTVNLVRGVSLQKSLHHSFGSRQSRVSTANRRVAEAARLAVTPIDEATL